MNLSTVCGESSFRVDRKKLNEKSNLKSEKKNMHKDILHSNRNVN